MTDTTVPAIAAGSKIEVNGALFSSATETAITGSPSDGVVYIYIDPSGPSAVFTNTAPTWSDSKQGWYGTGGAANCRYVEQYITKVGSVYTKAPMLKQTGNNSNYINNKSVSSLWTPTMSGNLAGGTRVMGTDYQNTYSYPITVYAIVNGATGASISQSNAYIGGVMVAQFAIPQNPSNGNGVTYILTIPPGSSYQIHNQSGTTLFAWYEQI
jgi:hypothetical protein